MIVVTGKPTEETKQAILTVTISRAEARAFANFIKSRRKFRPREH